MLSNNQSSQIKVSSGIEIAGVNIQLKLKFTIPDTKVTPTAGVDHNQGYISGDSGPTTVAQTVGGVYGVDQNGNVVAATNASGLVKSETVNVAIEFGTGETGHEFDYVLKEGTPNSGTYNTICTAADRDLLNNVTIYLQAKGTGQLRVNTERASGSDNKGYVGAAASYTNVDIAIGSIQFSSTGGNLTAAYTSTLDLNGSGNADEALNFFYSVSPKDNLGTSNESTNGEYGQFVVTTYTPQNNG